MTRDRASASKAVDVLIIGSGPVGCAYARRITELNPASKILMIEAGPQLAPRLGLHVKNLRDPEVRAAAQLASQGPARTPADNAPDRPTARPGTHLANPEAVDGMPVAALSTCTGGMGAHWTCACPRPGDSERAAFIPQAEMDDALDLAERYLAVTDKAFPDSAQGQAIEAGLSERFNERLGARKVAIMPLACTPNVDGGLDWTGGDTVLGPLIDASSPFSANFEIRSETLCSRLLHARGRVTGAALRDLRSGAAYDVQAKVVIVAADALRTPQLLWASGIRPEALGGWLNDQPQVLAGVTLKESMLGRRRNGLAFGKDARMSEIDPTTAVFWAPFADPQHPFHGQIMHLDVSPIGLNTEVSKEDSPGIVGLGWFCRKVDLRRADRVVFSDSKTDAFGMPAMRIEFELTERDLAEIELAKAEQLQAAAALGTLLPGDPSRLLPLGSSLHYQGTTRMGERDDGESVCDDRCRVWGFENLFVGGNGVIPTSTACNPTLTSVALAVRSADRATALAKN